ncbi:MULTISPECIES: NAD(P)-dependent oxidoreductase [Reichenbachiella]|uniref:D-3-phosphoglycerate dehydrogenase n=1 Tax=Reichenbachiella agariperforans TaxID=156994 RepID=A0A1M6UM89_REIAG|nr:MULTISPECIES: NAD(P)-dependent oxidoreductase [Reichenbachiella]RJE72453.1 phosphoglycerate dehydrogenase [Reichenbachiella sp. MSK19-1]SHK70375.1 D-3-phosphoglycerate dehydrogenase [Reichenbachiella agariperforans]
MKRILIIDEMHSSISDRLTAIGYASDYLPQITRQEIIEAEDHYVGMIVRSKTAIDAELLSSKPNLKFIARAGAGIDQVDVAYLDANQIQLVNAPEGNRDALGEHVIGMLLSLSNNLRKSDREVRSYVWDREGNRGFELSGKTIGLLGYGYMASAVAEKLSGFGCRVIAHDKYKTNFGDLYVEEVTMDDIYSQADVFSIHVPLTADTRMLVDAAYLARFDKNIVFVNAARGEIVNTTDLLAALKSGKVTHAALDVLENEKFAKLSSEQKATYDELFQLDNVLFSPHVGGWTFESYENINRVLVQKITALDV